MATDPQLPQPEDADLPDGSDSGENLASQSCQLYLAVFDDQLRRIPIEDGTLIIGRSRNSHLRIHDHLLSRKHCTLTRTGEHVLLSDLNSSNGSYVNGERVSTAQLTVDDIVEFGKTVMVIFDGEGWSRGDGMLNLRNPVKAQELVQRLREGGVGIEVQGSPPAPPDPGIRSQKGLTVDERNFLAWLEQGERNILPDLVGEYLNHKLISLLVRKSPRVRSAFTSVLESMMRPEFFKQVDDVSELRKVVRTLVEEELADLPRELLEAEALEDRGLLEPDPEPLSDEEGGSDASV